MATREQRMDLLARIELGIQKQREKEVIGWAVVSVDTEDDARRPVNASGLYATAEAALVAAGEEDAYDRRLGETGWDHHVVPVFPKGGS